MKSIWKMAIAAMAFAAAVLAAGGPAQAETYSFTNLGDIARAVFGTSYTLQMPENKAFGINDSGQVVGVLKGKFNGVSATHVMSWNISSTGTTATDLGSQLLYPIISTKSYAYGINNSGQIAGFTQPKGKSYYRAFVYDTATNTGKDLGTPRIDGVAFGQQATAAAVNDSGKAVGNTAINVGVYEARTAFIYDGTSIMQIPGSSPGYSSGANIGSSAAMAISNSGLVTGYSTKSGNIARAFIYDSNNGTAAGFTSLGTLAGLSADTNYYGIDINESGAVVGYTSETSISAAGVQFNIPFNNVTNPHAFLYTNADGMIDLGALGGTGSSQANAINNAGAIVGTSNGRAFIYENSQMFDLNELVGLGAETGFTLTTATGINNLGQIIGYGINASGEERAFALTLAAPTPTPIPPALLLFGSGLAGLGLFRRRTRA